MSVQKSKTHEETKTNPFRGKHGFLILLLVITVSYSFSNDTRCWIRYNRAGYMPGLPKYMVVMARILDYTFGTNNWGLCFFFTEKLPNSMRHIYNQVYEINKVFPTGALSEGPAGREGHDRNLSFFTFKPETQPTDEFNTGKVVFYDHAGDFVTQESTIFGQASVLLFLTTLHALENEKGADTVPGWEMQKSNTTASLRGVSAVSETTAWASGGNGTFLRTIDGGKNWYAGTIPGAAALDFRDVQAFDENTALVFSAGTPARVYRTADGGRTWKETYGNTEEGVFFDSMAFWDRQNGLAFSDPVEGSFLLITTTDGGETWHRVPPGNIPPPIPGEAGYAASGTMVAVQGEANAWFCTGGAAARVFRSTDRGKTWSAAKTPIICGQPSEGIFSVVFKDARNGIIVGGDYKQEGQNIKNAAVTTDGGVTWESIENARPTGFRECVAYVPGTDGKMVVTVGPSGSDYSMDGGKTWTNFSTVGFHSVSFAPGTPVAWAVGADGKIGKYRK